MSSDTEDSSASSVPAAAEHSTSDEDDTPEEPARQAVVGRHTAHPRGAEEEAAPQGAEEGTARRRRSSSLMIQNCRASFRNRVENTPSPILPIIYTFLSVWVWFSFSRGFIEGINPETTTFGIAIKTHSFFIVVTFAYLYYLEPWNAQTVEDKFKVMGKFLKVFAVVASLDAVVILVAQHPCLHCINRYKQIFSGELTDAITDLHGYNWFHVLMQNNSATIVCADCSRKLFWHLKNFGLLHHIYDTSSASDPDESWRLPKNVSDNRELKEWYNQFISEAKKSVFPVAMEYAIESLLSEGKISNVMFNSMSKEVLCHPGSRMGGPDAAQFLELLKTPMFTGEKDFNFNASSPEHLQLITKTIRGETMEKLSASACFMIRFAAIISEDNTVERRLISPFDVDARVNETGLKSLYGSHVAPAIVVPSCDEDVDKDGKHAKTLEALLTLYTKFDFDREPIYMDSREEYIVFARWELGHKIQQEWYHPEWLLAVDPDNAIRLLANQKLILNKRLLLSDSLSDDTLVDRMLYGTGSVYMSRVKLPTDEDYKYMHPAGPDYYKTDEERDFFLYGDVKKPAMKDFEKMIRLNWPDEIKCRPKRRGLFRRRVRQPPEDCKEDFRVEDFRSRMVEIDLSHFAAFETREFFDSPGAILYIDVGSKKPKPIGIWLASRAKLVLPGPHDEWEFAKFAIRSAIRNALAASHVMEYHLGWAHSVATASRQTLPADHSLRFFLKPYVYGTHSVNWAAYQMLVRKNSILTHASGLTSEGLANDLGHLHKHMNYSKTFPEFLEEKGLSKDLMAEMPLFSQGLRLWEVHRKYVESFINLSYSSDEAVKQDHFVNRFWHHVNTFGRHTDPCVCAMSSDRFFDDRNEWPAFEDSNTCLQLLNFSEFKVGGNDVTRRLEYCNLDTTERELKLGDFLKDFKEQRTGYNETILYDTRYLRSDMGLPKLQTRNDLVRFITTFVFQVTAGHGIFGDNLPYMTDPAYCAVRQRPPPAKIVDGVPLTDVATYIFGTGVAALTTIRSMPLLSDWMPLYEHWAIDRPDLTPLLEEIHNSYKSDLLRLANEFLLETAALPNNRRWTALNPATQMSSISV